jgi:hypothetical protein
MYLAWHHRERKAATEGHSAANVQASIVAARLRVNMPLKSVS